MLYKSNLIILNSKIGDTFYAKNHFIHSIFFQNSPDTSDVVIQHFLSLETQAHTHLSYFETKNFTDVHALNLNRSIKLWIYYLPLYINNSQFSVLFKLLSKLMQANLMGGWHNNLFKSKSLVEKFLLNQHSCLQQRQLNLGQRAATNTTKTQNT